MKSVQIRSYFLSVFSCIWTEYVDLRSKSPYSIRIQENTDQKWLRLWTLFTQWKLQEQKKCVIKGILKFNDYKGCLQNNKIILKLKRFKSEAHNAYTEETNKIARRSNDGKILQTFDRSTSYSYVKILQSWIVRI